MKIADQARASMTIFLAVLAVILGCIGVTLIKSDKLQEQGAVAARIEQHASQLTFISNEYLVYQDGRYLQRWNTKYAAIFSDLALLQDETPNKKALVNHMKENLRRVKGVFADTVAGLQERPSDPRAQAYGTRTLWSRMAVQNQELGLVASRLSQLLKEEESGLNRTNLVLVIILIASCCIYIVANNLLLYRRVLKSIQRLGVGAKTIGAGDLDFRIESGSDDEIGELCRAFNEMTEKLTQAYQVLEQEIGDRKEAQQALRRAKDELEVRVQERTADLARAIDSLQLEYTEHMKVAQESREKDHLLLQQSRLAAMGEMINSIAHQWRQPLNVLGMHIQRLYLYHTVGRLDEELLKSGTDDAMKLIQYMSQTIEDFRNFFKPDKEKSEFTASQALEVALSLVKESCTNHFIEVVTELEEDWTIEGYYNEFCQVLVNVVQNARDALVERATPGGKVILRSFVENGRAVITITDNAGGIPEEIIDRIFEPYVSTKGVQGTGIGLYMAKNIIENNMLGSITAVNSGAGAQFRIEV
jgi:C4-dicarboxylate-specific signal transduction histidine kinase